MEIVYLRTEEHPRGAYIPADKARISPWDRGFVFGDGVYEVVRVYQGRPFLLGAHLGRLRRSLREMRMADEDEAALEVVLGELLRRNNLAQADALIYLQITRGAAPRSHAFPDPPMLQTLFAAVRPYHDEESVFWHEGVAVATLSDFRWARCDIKTVALPGNVLALQHAREHRAYEALFVREGVVTEGSHSNFFGVLDGVVRTHPPTNHILAGVTRARVLELCRMASVPYREEPLTEIDLERLDEAFVTATSCEVVPVVRINDRQVGDGRPGEITRNLQQLWRERLGEGLRPFRT